MGSVRVGASRPCSAYPRCLSTFGLLKRLNSDILDVLGSGADCGDGFNGDGGSAFSKYGGCRIQRGFRSSIFSSKVEVEDFNGQSAGASRIERVEEGLGLVSSGSMKKNRCQAVEQGGFEFTTRSRGASRVAFRVPLRPTVAHILKLHGGDGWRRLTAVGADDNGNLDRQLFKQCKSTTELR